MEHTTIVETHSLTKRYGSGVLAVDSVDMSVRRGEVYGFLGPNGAGKTTTLRMLVGLIRPTSGTATVAGQAPGSPAGLARIGSLIESPGFYPYLSGRENLRVVADLANAKQKRVDEVLDMVELTSRAGRKFGTYSTGMKQRLGVAGALLKDPDLLILDEPTNGLDPQGMAEMRKLIKDIGQGDRTVLLSSHLLGEVEQICDRVGVISGGKLVSQSTVRELIGEKGVLVRADSSDRAAEILSRMFGAAAVSRQDGFIHLATDPMHSIDINRELVEYSAELASRPQVVVLTKMDLQEARDKWPEVKRRAEEAGLPAFAISSQTREGVQELMNYTAQRLLEIRRDEAEQTQRLAAEISAAGTVLRPEPEDAFTVEEVEDGFLVRGRRVERMVAMTQPESREGMERMERQLRKLGVTEALEQAGVMAGDHVHFGKVDLVWGEEM